MGNRDDVEVERKYDVGIGIGIPALRELPGVHRVAEPVRFHLQATYFDTPDLALTRAGITLRRRTGGDVAGWHLKLPLAWDRRVEIRLPLGEAASDRVPVGMTSTVRAFVRDHVLGPVCLLDTVRSVQGLEDATGATLAEFCDDQVTAAFPSGERASAWREWEVELVDADHDLLDAADSLLETAGARPAASASKLHRALRVEPSTAGPGAMKRLPDGTTGQVLTAYVEEHLSRMRWEDVRLRRGEAGAVHHLRIEARRLRSALATYRCVLEPGSSEGLSADLKWLGGALAEARDAQVLGGRLTALASAQPEALRWGPVTQRIRDTMLASFESGRAEAEGALDSERYFRLLDRLEQFAASPPFIDTAQDAPRRVLPRLLSADVARVRKRGGEAAGSSPGHDRDLALHEVRKAAKRLRYGAESATPVFGTRAIGLAQAATSLQEVLGEHQDTVVAREVLREMGLRAHVEGDDGFTFGLLYGLECARAEVSERDYSTVLGDLLQGSAIGWLDD